MALPIRKFSWLIFALVVGFLALLSLGAEFYTDLLWFDNLGYASVFWTILLSKWLVYLVVGVLFFAFLFFNLQLTKPTIGQTLSNLQFFPQIAQVLTARRVSTIFFLVSLVLAVMGSAASGIYWEVMQNFFHATTVGISDPLFNLDIGFFFFKLPFYTYVYRVGMSLVLLTLVAVGFIYFVFGSFGITGFRVMIKGRARYHLAVLGALAFLLKAFGYRLSMYNLVYSPRGVVFGASYTDVNVMLTGYKVLFWIALATAILMIVAAIIRKARFMVASAFLLLAGSVLIGNVYPSLVQQFIVEPNELAKEAPYIKHNIEYTLKAYGLDQVEERTFELQPELSYAELAKERSTVENIRLWDYRPLLSTYGQLQEMRLYYDFLGVDIDRYLIDGNLQQVAIAAREMTNRNLSPQARTWINQKLKYTHGYGVVVSPVNEVTAEGLPELWVKNIPPETDLPELAVDQPAIYYGETEDGYVIVNTKTGEFDYPLGDQNAYTNYRGTGGIQLSNILRKAAAAFRFSTLKILLSSDITSESRLMLYRNIHERVRKIAPFLSYDRDPYVVIADGKLYWIQDAYVTSDLYPYSEPVANWGNYIRNSVKVVIDAYNGQVDFYRVDEDEPIAKVYSKIFPDLFKPLEGMPASIRAHLRYPQDLMEIQAAVLAQYHMTDPTVFYNKEDMWNIPTEIVGDSEVKMEPYYLVADLDGDRKEDFILILPFTPVRKNNMIAWLAADSNPGEDYGRLVLYKFPKQALTYGPMQIEARIDQDSEISRQLTLWNQRGSSVIRGNLLVIPIRGTILYVEPLYLRSEQSELPELKRVIVAYGNRVVMANTLDAALREVAGGPAEPFPAPEVEVEPDRLVIPDGIQGELVSELVRLFNRAQEDLSQGDWEAYGQRMARIQEIIDELEEKSGGE
ncbi:MAG: UPF0182 family protein [Firmicutes bacterium]|nr:UPF0182 family protein [Bacillota bacterium]